LRRQLDRASQNKLDELQKDVDSFQVNSPDAPPRAMVLRDKDQPYDPKVFVRGDPGRPGKDVPRQFPRILSEAAPDPFTEGSGRLELARAIVSPVNPLTARVIVNRVWQHHFGRPLVSTSSDFGTRSDPPSHPELLDYLACQLRDNNWSLKSLHREIMLSSTYRQASTFREDCAAMDPENRTLWRMNPRRLEWEALRDTLLAYTGRLDTSLDGRPVDLMTEPFTTRRTVYGEIDRQDLPGLFRAFDIASPDASSPGRSLTTVPQQALFLMNSPFVHEQARHLAARIEGADPEDAITRVKDLYRTLFARSPSAEETALAAKFLDEAAVAKVNGEDGEPAPANAGLNPWQQYVQMLLVSNEVLFVD
jgi:hypothetical protein